MPTKEGALTSTVRRLDILSNKSLEFYHKFIKDSFSQEPDMPGLNLFRLSYLNKIKLELSAYFHEEKSYQMVVNLFNICYNLEKRINAGQPSSELFEHLFYSACLIVIKIETPHKMKNFKVKLIEEGWDLAAIYKCEGLILTDIEWKVNLSTPAEMQKLLLYRLFKDSSEVEKNDLFKLLNERIGDWISYAMSEISLYLKYDQYTLVIACCLLVFRYENMADLEKELMENSLDYKFDRSTITNVFKEIIDCFMQDSPENTNEADAHNEINATVQNTMESTYITDLEGKQPSEANSEYNSVRPEEEQDLPSLCSQDFLKRKKKSAQRKVKKSKKNNWVKKSGNRPVLLDL